MKRWECWVIGVAVIVVAFLFALNGRYYVIPNGGYVIDKWTRTMYTTKGTFKYPDQPIYKQQEVSVVPEGGRKLTLDEAYEKVVNGNDPSGQKRPTLDEIEAKYYKEKYEEEKRKRVAEQDGSWLIDAVKRSEQRGSGSWLLDIEKEVEQGTA